MTRAVQVTLEVVVRRIEPHLTEPGTECVTAITTMRRVVMLPPVLSLGMTIANEGWDDSKEFAGYRVDSLRSEVSTGTVAAVMCVRSDRATFDGVLREWRNQGWV